MYSKLKKEIIYHSRFQQKGSNWIPMGICPSVAIKAHKGQFFLGLLVWMQWMVFPIFSPKMWADPLGSSWRALAENPVESQGFFLRQNGNPVILLLYNQIPNSCIHPILNSLCIILSLVLPSLSIS